MSQAVESKEKDEPLIISTSKGFTTCSSHSLSSQLTGIPIGQNDGETVVTLSVDALQQAMLMVCRWLH